MPIDNVMVISQIQFQGVDFDDFDLKCKYFDWRLAAEICARLGLPETEDLKSKVTNAYFNSRGNGWFLPVFRTREGWLEDFCDSYIS